MPSQKPRIALTVEPDVNNALERLSSLTGEPKTRIINDFLGQLLPVFLDMADSLQHIKETKEAIPQLARWTAFANEQVAVMNNEMANLLAQPDMFDKEKKND